MLLQEIGEKEELQDDEDDEQLNQDDSPERFAQTHVAEPVVIEVEDTIQEALFFHLHVLVALIIVANIVNKFKTPNFSLSFHRKNISLQLIFLKRNCFMNKKLISLLAVVIAVLLIGTVWLAISLNEEKQVNRDMQELAMLDKMEMENEYQQFAAQYGEMKTRINNDSIVAQLTREQLRTQELLEELRKTKANDAAEITRLKKELATVRAILRSYVLQIDSLNRLNAELTEENTRVRSELEASNQQNMQLTSSNQSLSEKVAIASQLNAANIDIMMLVKNGKERTTHPHKIGAVGLVKATGMKVKFVLSRNTTAQNGMRTIYVRIINPSGEVIPGGGNCVVDGKNVACTAHEEIEYTGEERHMSMFVPKTTMMPGRYVVQVIADGHEIGSRGIELEK